MVGWMVVSRNPMSLQHVAIGTGGARIALEPGLNKVIQAKISHDNKFSHIFNYTSMYSCAHNQSWSTTSPGPIGRLTT